MSRKSENTPKSREPRGPTTSVTRNSYLKWTQLGFPEIHFSWVIENFSIWIASVKRRKVKIAYSPEFPAGPSATKWRMVFRIDDRQTSLFLDPVECPENMQVQFYFKVYGNCRVLVTGGFTLKFTPDADEFQGCKNLYNVYRLVEEAKIRGNELTISCEVVIEEILRKNVQSNSADIQKFHVANAKLHADMGKLLQMDNFGDVELVVGNRTFTAYKGILAARSSVFADMFEGQGNRYQIDDMEPSMFEEVLRYIYTDQVSDLGVLKFPLFAAAHRFNIGSLKQLCQDAILAGLSADTVVEALKTGANCEAHEMKHKTLAFICNESIEMPEVRGWDELQQSLPGLASEALYIF
ncbi:protein roadkill-like [Culex quinquefasciatus]|uniref:protein roadkill-like n=1 Tax=Culex quinquefasciatus TaxID=7176 RepID=UPI0018E3BA57|nr:protein roadkill-like [Culex quinquefasciatus]